ncbi:MAG: PD-(D/E)XK nuclease family protein, partial [Duncaniella sp.]|nr:PD-(D/E)XK nuclease family protein [Duncaniella sp.]
LMERSIVVPGEQPRRFDRVVWTADGEIQIIDYKTGHQPSKKYRKQMAGYKRLISELYSMPVKAFLYYLDTGQIVEMYG